MFWLFPGKPGMLSPQILLHPLFLLHQPNLCSDVTSSMRTPRPDILFYYHIDSSLLYLVFLFVCLLVFIALNACYHYCIIYLHIVFLVCVFTSVECKLLKDKVFCLFGSQVPRIMPAQLLHVDYIN